MHSVGSRLKVWRESVSLKQAEAAERVGLPASTYQNYERDVRAPNTEGWEAFVKAGINANWLLTGEGSMLRVRDEPASSDSTALEAPMPSSGYVAIPLYNEIRAAAGVGALNHTEVADDALMFKEDWVHYELGARPKDLCLIRVHGDSMEPTLRAGDVILIDHRACRPDREGIYILRMGEMLLVKRLQAIPGGQLRVISDNSAFDSWVLKVADIGVEVDIIGRVVWAGRRF